MDDDDWQERAMDDASTGVENPPLLVVCFFDSLTELRGYVEQCWEELQTAFSDPEGEPELAGLSWKPEHLAVRIHIDAGLEISLRLYPIVDGSHREDLGEGESRPLLQLHDDGGGGIDAAQLRLLLDWLLEDILPYVGNYDASIVEERFAGGQRSLVLADPIGQLLDLPGVFVDAHE